MDQIAPSPQRGGDAVSDHVIFFYKQHAIKFPGASRMTGQPHKCVSFKFLMLSYIERAKTIASFLAFAKCFPLS
jgi:hypothetical protein